MAAHSSSGPPLSVVFTRVEALAAGWSRHEVQSRCSSGRWRRLARGVYCTAEAWDAAGPDDRYRHAAVATWLRWPGTVLSHTSAAALWRLPMPPVAWVSGEPALHERRWLTAPPSSGAPHLRTSTLTRTVAALGPGDAVTGRSTQYQRRLRVTSRARTVVDCLRHLPTAAAVAFADAAGAAGVSRSALAAVLDHQSSWWGAARAREGLALVDPRRETWLESASVVGLVQRGLPSPEPQVELCTPEGRFVARVDGWWQQQCVVGEADGWAKYRVEGLRSAEDAERALRREKQREDAVRALGPGFVRWSSSGVLTPARMDRTAAAVGRALHGAEPWRLRAVVKRTPLPEGW